MSASDLNTLLDRLGPIGSRVWDAARLQVAVGIVQDAFWIISMVAAICITYVIARRFWNDRDHSLDMNDRDHSLDMMAGEAIAARIAIIVAVIFGGFTIVLIAPDLIGALANPDYAAWRYIIGTLR